MKRRAIFLGLTLVVLLVGCVQTSRRTARSAEEIQADVRFAVEVPAGWTMTESGYHLVDAAEVFLRVAPGVGMVIELTRGEVEDLQARLDFVRGEFLKRFPGALLRPANDPVGSHEALGFEGLVRIGGRSDKVLFRCFNTGGRHVAVTCQGEQMAFGGRYADIRRILGSLRVDRVAPVAPSAPKT